MVGRLMISLDQLLDGLEVEIEPFLVCDPRRERFPDRERLHEATVHCTLGGAGVLDLTGGATLRISTNSVTIVPPQPRGRFTPERRPRRMLARRPPGPAPVEGSETEAGDPDILVAAGRIRATYKGMIDLFDNLQEPLVERVASDDPIRRFFEELVEEIRANRPGCRAMTEALLRRCLILLLRRYCERVEQQPALAGRARGCAAGRAVALMQHRLEQSFTLPRLAEVAGMSRSVFAARFVATLRQSPIEFLKRLRPARAAQLLARTDLPVKAVAGRVGYASRSSFTRLRGAPRRGTDGLPGRRRRSVADRPHR